MSRLWNLFRKTKLDRQLDEEFQFHVDMLIEQYLKRGLTREQAEREARREFGAVEAAKDAYRDQRGWPWLDDWVLDLRHAVRLLLRYPGPLRLIVDAANDSPMSLHVQVPDLDIVPIEGSSHWLMLDRPDEFGLALKEFLDATSELPQ